MLADNAAQCSNCAKIWSEESLHSVLGNRVYGFRMEIKIEQTGNILMGAY
jgi:hypothetical protein